MTAPSPASPAAVTAQPFPPILLREHDTQEVDLTAKDVEVLRALDRYVKVSRSFVGDTWEVQTGDWVGAVGLPSRQLLIAPKIPEANLLRLLIRGKDVHLERHAFSYADGLGFPGLLTDLFVAAAGTAVGRGRLHDYRTERDVLPYVRGRIDFTAALAHAWRLLPVPCEFADFTADISENRALLAATSCLLLSGLPDPPRAEGLRRLLGQLEGVTPAPCTAASVRSIARTRLNRRYWSALDLAALILAHLVVLERPGGASAWSFLVSMDSVFEAYVADVLQRSLPMFGLTVERQVQRALFQGGRVGEIRVDIVIHRSGKPILVLDTKYKDLAAGKAPATEDAYQMIAYCANLDVHRGVIVYPEATEADRAVVHPTPITLSILRFPLVGTDALLQEAEQTFVHAVSGMAG